MDNGYQDIIDNLRVNGYLDMADRFERLVRETEHDRARHYYEAMAQEANA